MTRPRKPDQVCGSVLASALLLALPAAARAQSVDYQQLQALFGEPVTTSVTGAPQRASEAPAALTIITREDIRRSPAKDLVGLLRAYAGVDAARWTAQQGEVSLRGGIQPFNSRLLVLVNGQQVYLDHYGMTSWSLIGVQLQDIQQIEVIRGPNSALFGFNAVSGVINIITINPLQTQEATLIAEAGTRGYGRVSANAAVKLGERFGLHLSGGYSGLDELRGLGASPVASTFAAREPARASGTAELYGRLGDKTEAALSANYSWSRQTEVVNDPVSTPTRSRLTSLGARISHDTGWGLLSARIYNNQSNQRAPLGVQADGKLVSLDLDNDVTVASAAAVIRAGDSNTGRLGLEFRDNSFHGSPGYPGDTHYRLYAVSGMWETAPLDWLTFTLAGRLDHMKLDQEGLVDQPSLYAASDFKRDIDAFSLNAAALFKLNPRSTLRFAGGRGVQAPSLYSLGGRLVIPIPGSVPFVLAGNPRLKPSVIWSGEAGYSRLLGDHGGRLEVNAFYNRTTELIGAPDGSTPPILTPPAYPYVLTASRNVGSFKAYGVEATVSGRLGPSVAWSVNYTWTKASQDILGERGDSLQWPIALDRSTPEHKLKAQATYEGGPWLATIAARYTSKGQQLIHVGPQAIAQLAPLDIDETVAVDAKLAYRLTSKVVLEAAGENLTGADGVDLSPVPAERRLRAGVRVQF